MRSLESGSKKPQAFVGVGTMGSLMAGCLLDAGVELTVYDIRRAAASTNSPSRRKMIRFWRSW
ncbi:MAG: NAD(P)-dependent oxidoreductase [Chloroflexi bacterium]|nr:NAD(P)-dependent oxidoreductase [Chloroflexota bacterium]MYD48991.1 NAD(P)-dependent oxidoreductase [Chloroflexota bacterium]